jgi:hypothetical protein
MLKILPHPLSSSHRLGDAEVISTQEGTLECSVKNAAYVQIRMHKQMKNVITRLPTQWRKFLYTPQS